MPEVISSKLISEDFTAELKGQNSGSLSWRVQADGNLRAPEALFKSYSATPDPVLPIGTYVGNGLFVLRNPIRRLKDDNAVMWIVNAECGPWPSEQGDPTGGGTVTEGIYNHPLKRKMVWSAERIVEQEHVENDYNGVPIVNSANRKYDEALWRDRFITVFVGQKNFATLDSVIALNDTYDNTVNRDVTLGRPIDTLRYLGAEISQPQYENGVTFYTATIRLAYKKESWYRYLINRGWGYYDRPKTSSDARYINAGDGVDQPIHEPVLLATDGTKLSENATPTSQGWMIYTRTSYASLVADPVYP